MKEKEELLSIISGVSNRIRINYFEANQKDILGKMLLYCKDIIDLPFKQIIWHYANQEPNYIKCRCGKDLNFNRNWLDGYKGGCSAKCAQSDPKVKEARKNTTLKLYGVDNIAKLEETKIATEKTNMSVYGTKSTFQNEEVKQKWKDNIMRKYGVEHVFQLESVKEQSKKTSIEKYGKEYYVQSQEYKDSLTDNGFIERLRQRNIDNHNGRLLKHNISFINKPNNWSFDLKSIECGHEFHIIYSMLMHRIRSESVICTLCNKVEYSRSEAEKELSTYIESLGFEVENSYKKLGKEIDIFIPKLNIGIEYNDLYWHTEANKGIQSHIKKSNLCDQNNIKLIHIWEDQWLIKKELVKSLLLKELYPNKTDIVNYSIRNVSKYESTTFLESNSLYGYRNSSIFYGLYVDNTLVSLMGFKIKSNNDWKISTFSDMISQNYDNSFNILKNHFISNNEFNELTYEIDRCWVQQDNIADMELIEDTKPDYYWSDDINRYKEYSLRHLTNGIKDKLEHLYNIGYNRIFDAGLRIYKYKK